MKTAIPPLAPDDLESYVRDGFIIAEDLLSPEQVSAVKEAFREIIRRTGA